MKLRGSAVLLGVAVLSHVSCTPDWAKSGQSDAILLMTSINNGFPLESDVVLNNGGICPDIVSLRVENHFKNPNVTGTGFRFDFTVERYEVRYIRSDGRNVQGVDVPFTITGNMSREVISDEAIDIPLEVVRRQAKIEPPLKNLSEGGGAVIVTMFAEITLHARTTTGQVLNSVTGRMQIDFADFATGVTTCPTSSNQ